MKWICKSEGGISQPLQQWQKKMTNEWKGQRKERKRERAGQRHIKDGLGLILLVYFEKPYSHLQDKSVTTVVFPCFKMTNKMHQSKITITIHCCTQVNLLMKKHCRCKITYDEATLTMPCTYKLKYFTICCETCLWKIVELVNAKKTKLALKYEVGCIDFLVLNQNDNISIISIKCYRVFCL